MMNKNFHLMRIMQVLLIALSFNHAGVCQQLYGQQDPLRGNEINTFAESKGNSGVPNITVPLFNEFPVSLSYDASGIKPDRLSTEVGLGWSLEAGGEVTRTVRGIRDEEGGHAVGLSTQEKAQWDMYTRDALHPGQTSGAQTSSILQDAVEGYDTSHRDLAPDEFSYNVMGRTGKFIMVLDANSNYVALSTHKILVSFTSGPSYRFNRDPNTPSQGSIGSITIVFEDGVRCVFAQPEISTNDVAPMPNGSRAPDPITVLNTWKVTQVTIPGQVMPIMFEYSHIYDGPTKYYSSEMRVGMHTIGSEIDMMTATAGVSTVNTQSLTAVKGASFNIQFEYGYAPAQQYANSLLILRSASLFSRQSKLAEKYEFRYTRVGKNRVLMSSVEKTGIAGGVIKSGGVHKFEYNTATTMPDFDYFTIDDFYRLMGQNAYSNSTNTAPPLSNTAGVDWWGYYSGVIAPYNTLISDFYSYPLSTPLSVVSFDQNFNGNTREPNPGSSQALILQKIIFPSGGYTQYIFENNDYSLVAFGSHGGNAGYRPITAAGGLRIKQIIKSDGVNNARNIIKQFEYRREADGNSSSGVVANTPFESYSFNSPMIETYDAANGFQTFQEYSASATSNFSLAPIGFAYSCIKEINGDGSYTVYNYSTVNDNYSPEDNVINFGSYSGVTSSYLMQTRNRSIQNVFSRLSHPFVRGKSQNECMRGLLLEEKAYSSTGIIVKKQTYSYARYDVGNFTNAFEQYFLPGRPMYAWGCYCSQGGYSNPITNPANANFADCRFWRAYNIYVAFPHLTRKVEQLYDQNSTIKFRQAQTDYTLNTTNFQTSRVVQTDIAGRISAEELYYSSDYENLDQNGNPQMNGAITAMRQNNLLTSVVEHRSLKNLQSVTSQGQVVKGELTELQFNGLPVKKYVLETNAPLSNFVFDARRYLLNNSYYKARKELTYDLYSGKLISSKSTNGTPTTTIWAYNDAYPVASIVGASPTAGQTFYTSFEDERWIDTNSPVFAGGKTGVKHWQGAFNVPLPSVPGSYKLTYWRASATIAQPWTYQEDDVVITSGSSNTHRTIGVGDWIDEVRLYPVGSLISTQTYEPLYGVASSMNHNGVQQTVEYDALGRKTLLKDDNADIVEAHTYGKVSQFTVTITSSGSGGTTPTGTREVLGNEGFEVRLNPAFNRPIIYRIDSSNWITVTHGSSPISGPVASYAQGVITFTNVTANHTLEIVYQ